MTENQQISNGLKKLAINTIHNLPKYLENNIIKPQQELYLCSEVSSFEYNSQGITSLQEKIVYKDKQTLRINFESIETTDEYLSILCLNSQIQAYHIQQFIHTIVSCFLEQGSLDEADLEKIINYFTSDIAEEPITYNAYVKLEGIILATDAIEFLLDDININLRKPVIGDLEEELPVYSMHYRHAVSRKSLLPSAILSISYRDTVPRKLQEIIQQSIVILKIFKVGSIEYLSYNIKSEEAILFPRKNLGIFSLTPNNTITENSIIYEEDKSKLKDFWKSMMKVLPQNFYNYSTNESSHLRTAYQHYSDALLHAKTLEEKIAKTVIGLEALLLYENMEIAFRFRVRGAKILGILGHSAIEVKNILKLAYDIRSLFVHGDDGELEKKMKNLKHKYPETHNFLIKLLDYLRIILLVMIGLGENAYFTEVKKDKKLFLKKKVIELLDDALIDKTKEDELINYLKLAVNQVSLDCFIRVNNSIDKSVNC